MSKKQQIPISTIGVVLLVLVYVTTMLFIISGRRQKQAKTPDIQEHFNYMTPTILPSTKDDTLIFQHPQNHFSFEYPTDWNINMIKRTFSDGDNYSAVLSGKIVEHDFRIHFLNDYRGLPHFDYDRIEEKQIGQINTKWRTMYKNDNPFEISIMFNDENNPYYPNLIGLYIYLPQQNQEEFIKQVEEIIASLE